MKALIFSDSHGDYFNMRNTINNCHSVEYVFFLGDGIREYERARDEFRDKIFYCVRGNNDWMADYRDELVLEFEGKRVLLTHGHNHRVKYTEQNLLYLAREKNIDVVLFGHTHQPYEQYFELDGRGIYLFNPGSIGKLSLSPYYHFGRLDISEAGIILSHGRVTIGKF